MAILAPRQHTILFQVSSGKGDNTNLLFLECDCSDTFLERILPWDKFTIFFSGLHTPQFHTRDAGTPATYALSEGGEKEEGRRRDGNSSALMLLN